MAKNRPVQFQKPNGKQVVVDPHIVQLNALFGCSVELPVGSSAYRFLQSTATDVSKRAKKTNQYIVATPAGVQLEVIINAFQARWDLAFPQPITEPISKTILITPTLANWLQARQLEYNEIYKLYPSMMEVAEGYLFASKAYMEGVAPTLMANLSEVTFAAAFKEQFKDKLIVG